MKETEVVIIGAGPAGITAALYLKRAGISLVWLEKGAPGGKILTIPGIENYPGLPKATGMGLAESLLQSTSAEGIEPEFGDVKSVTRDQSGFHVSTDDENYRAKAVVVATGLSNVPSIPGEKAFFGKGVSYCATCDGPIYRNKTIAVYGTGDRTLEEALYLAPLVKKLFLLTPDSQFHGEARLLASLKENPSVEIHCSAKMTEIRGSSHVETIAFREEDALVEKAVDAIFPLFGEKSASAFLSSLRVKEERGFLDVDEMMATSVPGLFAAGDIVRKKVRQVVTAASDGAVASSGVVAYLRSLKGADYEG